MERVVAAVGAVVTDTPNVNVWCGDGDLSYTDRASMIVELELRCRCSIGGGIGDAIAPSSNLPKILASSSCCLS